MVAEGKYLYCIIGSPDVRNFGPIGIGGRGDVVHTINYGDLSGVVSDSPLTKYALSRENLTTHEKVVEAVMKEYTVLPVRFCTIATSAEEIRSLLRKRYAEFKNLLRDMDNKIELGIKALWKDMTVVFEEIATGNGGIKQLKDRVAARPASSYGDRITLGEMVQAALQAKKKAEGEKLMALFKKISVDVRTNRVFGDSMILNGAFLVDRSREKEFDSLVADFTEHNQQRMRLMYVGPTPPFNFVSIEVKWTEIR